MKNFDFYEFVKTHKYYDFGTIKRGRQKVATFYKCDKVNADELNYANVFILSTSPVFAPELKKATVFVLSNAEIKRAKESGVSLEEHINLIKSQLCA